MRAEGTSPAAQTMGSQSWSGLLHKQHRPHEAALPRLQPVEIRPAFGLRQEILISLGCAGGVPVCE